MNIHTTQYMMMVMFIIQCGLVKPFCPVLKFTCQQNPVEKLAKHLENIVVVLDGPLSSIIRIDLLYYKIFSTSEQESQSCTTVCEYLCA